MTVSVPVYSSLSVTEYEIVVVTVILGLVVDRDCSGIVMLPHFGVDAMAEWLAMLLLLETCKLQEPRASLRMKTEA